MSLNSSAPLAGQELPPGDGFGPLLYERHIPKRGPPSWVWLVGISGFIATGFYLHHRGLRIMHELEREKRQARLQLTPLLLAEQDRGYMRQKAESIAMEQTIMANVPHWRVGESVYNTKEFVPDTYFHQATFK